MTNEDRTEDNAQHEPIWKPYIGREVNISFGNSSVLGFFKTADSASNYADFLPSIILEADDKHVYLENKTPTRISLSLIEKGEVIIRPLRAGYLEARVKHLNNQADKNTAKIGFDASAGSSANASKTSA